MKHTVLCEEEFGPDLELPVGAASSPGCGDRGQCRVEHGERLSRLIIACQTVRLDERGLQSADVGPFRHLVGRTELRKFPFDVPRQPSDGLIELLGHPMKQAGADLSLEPVLREPCLSFYGGLQLGLHIRGIEVLGGDGSRGSTGT
ncbi:hypothetical protein CH063_10233 [Colletotrichum higginsianum]|uniref:Uncharacterized protein n=1 Tax=Colletotrichum higginsianum (strain IMI 349063) TaxID=759273 RepID=H1VGN0_COLHI|nr:hypothetical protein CH063_10233 [Colletotrichum higginsianum]